METTPETGSVSRPGEVWEGTDRIVSERSVRVTVLMPCLNEGETLAGCIEAAKRGVDAARVPGEVLVVDNGSTDGSPEIAREFGARVVAEQRKGYGSALQRGCVEARGDVIVMGDADGSYDLSALQPFFEAIEDGAELVMGTRLRGTILPGAMPWKNQHIGNPFLTWLLNALFGTRVSDVHCGLRAFSKDAYARMRLRSPGMEFASEMVMKAAIEEMRIEEVPIVFGPDGRSRPPHLRPWRDGWRHLKLILLFSPSALFLVPGLVLLAIGIGLMSIQLTAPMERPLRFAGVRMDFHWAILGSLLTIVGYQVVFVNMFAKTYALVRGMRRHDPFIERVLSVFTIERVAAVGSLAVVAGLAMDLVVVVRWLRTDLGTLVSGYTRLFIFGSTLVALGVQTVFGGFFLGILGDDVESDHPST